MVGATVVVTGEAEWRRMGEVVGVDRLDSRRDSRVSDWFVACDGGDVVTTIIRDSSNEKLELLIDIGGV